MPAGPIGGASAEHLVGISDDDELGCKEPVPKGWGTDMYAMGPLPQPAAASCGSGGTAGVPRPAAPAGGMPGVVKPPAGAPEVAKVAKVPPPAEESTEN
mmetsp:Transcript_681/g.1798  ORF Transcript_681/g.1798 Transcript_681/m.1798 type:complete len:99 (-) Transcript_681:456-752(-)